MTCKYCGESSTVVKFGSYKGTPLYYCKACKRKFKAGSDLFHMKVPAEYVSSALDMYYKGMSIDDICEHLKQEHGYHPSKSVVFDWVDKFTNKAVKHFREYKPDVGDEWVADETMLDLDGGRQVWFWDILDSKTRFLLASRASVNRTSEDARLLMESAYKRAGKAPKTIITDKLRSYLDGVELTFGSDTDHIQGSPFGKDSTSIIERFHGTLKDRTKVMRSFRDMDTLIQFTDGFLVYYNFFKPHDSLGGKTPAEVANVKYDIRNWAELARLPVSKRGEVIIAETKLPKSKVKPPPKPKRVRRVRHIGKGITFVRGVRND